MTQFAHDLSRSLPIMQVRMKSYLHSMESPFNFNKSVRHLVDSDLSGGSWHAKSVYTSSKILLPLLENHYITSKGRGHFCTPVEVSLL